MKKLFLITICFTTLFSCVSVEFEQAQPIKTKSLSEFPKSLQGKYLLSYKDSLNELDTLIINKNYFTKLVLSKKEGKKQSKENIFLSDSLILKEFDNNYILNFKDKEAWTPLVIKPLKGYGYSILWIDGDNKESIKEIKPITEVKVVKDNKGKIEKYILNPKKAAYKKIIKKKGVYTELYKLKKLPE